MKKIYLTLGLGVLLLGANAQQKAKLKHFAAETAVKSAPAGKSTKAIKNARNGNNAAQAVVWSDDFSTPANWVSTDNNAGTEAWTIGTVGPTFATTLTINSTSGGNFALFDSDFYGQSAANNVDLTTASAINLVGHPNVNLVFQQLYAHYADVTTVYVSGDNGTTWTPFVVNGQYAQNAQSPNPETITLNISSVAGNQAQVKVRFNFTGNWDYMWEVDDVSIQDIPAADGAITGVTVAAPDCDLTSTEKVMVDIKNNGAAPLAGFSVSYKVNALAAVVETYTGSIAAGATATHTFAATADFSAPGVVQMVAASLTVTADANTANDKDTAYTENLVPTVDTLNENFDGASAMLGWAFAGANQAAWYFSGVNHSAPNALGFNNGAAITTGIDDWVITSCVNLTAGTTYFVQYWSIVPTNTVSTYDATLDVKIGNDNTIAAMTNSIATVTVNTSAYTMHHHTFSVSTTGTYNVGFHVTPGANPGTWFRMDDVIIGREPSSGVNTVNSKELSVYPNPTNGVLNINATASASVEFYNAMGQNVMSKSLTNGANAVDMSGLSSGVYSVRIIQNGTATITKVIKN